MHEGKPVCPVAQEASCPGHEKLRKRLIRADILGELSAETLSPDNAASAALLANHRPALQRYAAKLLGGQTAPVAAVLEAVATELRTSPPEEQGDQLVEWFFASCRRHALKSGGGDGPRKRLDAGDGEQASGRANPSAGEAAEAEEPHVTMQRLIDRLTPKQQEAVRLRFQNGFSHVQIAGIVELSVFNVGGLMHHALLHLDREYQAAHPDPAGERRLGVGDDARLTSYALGEMEEAERGRFEDSLLDKKSAATRVENIRALGTLIGRALAIEAGAPAPRTVRRKKRSGLAAWFRFPRVLLPVGLAVLIAVGIYFAAGWNKEEDQSAGTREKVDFSLKPAKWKEEAAEPEAVHDARVSGGGGGGGDTGSGVPVSFSGPKAGAVHSPKEVLPPAAVREPELPRARGVESGQNTPELPAPAAGPGPDAPEQSAHSGGAPTGEIPTGVAATLRGEAGEVQRPPPAATGSAAPEDAGRKSAGQAAPDDDAVAQPPVSTGSKLAADESKPGTHAAKARAPVASLAGGSTERKFESPKDAAGSQLPPDVSTTSVGVLKAALAGGRVPSPGGVKIEQLLNYFPIRCLEPGPGTAFAATLEAADAPWDPTHRLVRVSLKGRDAPVPARGAACLVLLIDISGSMAAPNKLPLVREAVRLLLGHLRPDDRIGIVTFAEEPRLVLLPTPVMEAREILKALEPLEAKGPTNGGAGLELAYDLAKAHRAEGGPTSVLICSDGDFNAGPTREDELAKLIDRQAKSQVKLSVLGFGRGRAIDPRLEAMARRGGGRSGYVNTRRDAELALVRELDDLFEPLAKDVKVEVAFNPQRVQGYRLVGYDDQPSGLEPTAAPPDARTVLPGHALTALYEVVPVAGAVGGDLLTVNVGYRTPIDGVSHRQQFSLKEGGAGFAQASLEFKFAAAIATFGLVLQNSPQRGRLTLDDVEVWARECLGPDEGGYRSEFLSLVEQARAARP